MRQRVRPIFTLGIILAQLGLALGVMTALSRPAAPGVPAGFTDTPIPVETSTPPPTDAPSATPQPTNTPMPTETPPPPPPPTDAPSATPQPTNTPMPTETPPPPPPPTDAPSATPQPTNTPMPTESPAATVTPQPFLFDPYVIKQASLEQAQVGDIVVFTIDVINPNPVPIDNVVVSDALSEFVDYLSATVPRGSFSHDATTNRWTLNLGAMGPNERLTLTITTRVNARGQPPNTLLNTVTLTSNRGVTQSNTTRTLIVPAQLPVTGR